MVLYVLSSFFQCEKSKNIFSYFFLPVWLSRQSVLYGQIWLSIWNYGELRYFALVFSHFLLLFLESCCIRESLPSGLEISLIFYFCHRLRTVYDHNIMQVWYFFSYVSFVYVSFTSKLLCSYVHINIYIYFIPKALRTWDVSWRREMVFIHACLYDAGYKKNVIILWVILFETLFLFMEV